MLSILFWAGAALIIYTYFGFAALVFLRSLLCRKSWESGDIQPEISVIIIAHNEADVIGKKLENILSLNYPPDRIEVIVASDGSTDDTDAVVAGFAARGVKLLSLQRQGKIPALNTAVAASTGEIAVFTDANSMFSPRSLDALLAPFADRQVGGVAGNQVYTKHGSDSLTAEGECAYWNFDRMLKQAESQAWNVTSATGAIYAIRRSLFRPVPTGVTDDFVTSTRVIAQGYRLVYVNEAIASEPVAVKTGTEFGRKVRVMTRGFRALIVMRGLFNPFRHGFYSLQLLSHKLLRRLMIVPLLVLLVTGALLWNHSIFYQIATLAQTSLYVSAAFGLCFKGSRLRYFKGFTIPFYFCMVNAAALLALLNTLRGRRIELWEPKRQESPTDNLQTIGST